MSDNIERIHEEPLLRCSSIKKTDDDRKSGGSFNFDKRKKKDGKKEDKVCKKPISCNGQEPADDVRGIGPLTNSIFVKDGHKESPVCVPASASHADRQRTGRDETHPEENQCGKIIDMEA